MTDARYPEAWLNDRRVVRLSDAAHRLYVTANAWSASNRTDGFVETADLALIHGIDASKAAELATIGLWKQVTGGWLIVDFHKTQTTKAQLEGLDHKRHQDRERKARERARKHGNPDPEPDSEQQDVPRDVPRDGARDTKARTGRTGREESTIPEPVLNVTGWTEVGTLKAEDNWPEPAPIPNQTADDPMVGIAVTAHQRHCPDCGAEVPPGHVKCQPCMRAARRSA